MESSNFTLARPDAEIKKKGHHYGRHACLSRTLIDQVAMMVAYPMLRTTLIDLAARLDLDAPLLPLHRIGYLSPVEQPELGRAED